MSNSGTLTSPREKTNPAPTLEQVEVNLATRYFDWFVRLFWDTIVEDPLVWNWHMSYLCEEMQIVAERVFKRLPKEYDLIINIPPGTTKSTITTIMFPAWCWVHDPSLKFLPSSYSAALSLEHADKSREVIRSSKYQKYFPQVRLRRDKDLKSDYETTRHGGRFSSSTGGAATGRHAHFIMPDDPINPKQAMAETRKQLKATNDYLDRTLSTRKVDKRVTPMIMIMQRLCQGDPTDHMLDKKKKIKHICLPAEVSDMVTPPELKERYIDGLLDPVRLNREVLVELRSDLTEVGYAGQIEQRPMPEGGSLFKVENFKTLPATPNPGHFEKIVRYWDKAGTQDGGKRTAGVKMGKLRSGIFVVLDCVAGQWSALNREKRIKQTAELDGHEVEIWHEQEGGSGGKESAENTTRMLAGYNVHSECPTGSKEARAESYAAQVEAGNVYLVKNTEWNKAYIDEHESAPNGIFKDRWDAAAGAFNKIAAGPKRHTWGRGK